MPAKRKEEAKSATDIEIDAAYDAMQKGEAAVQNCKDAMTDLTTHATRLKQLEAELAPREAEHRAIIEKFQRVLEGGCVYRKQRGPGAHIAAANAEKEASRAALHRPSSKPTTPRGRLTGVAPALAVQDSAADEKEFNKFFAQLTREAVNGMLQPLFMLPRTPNELHNAAVLAAKLHEINFGGPAPSGSTTAASPSGGKLTPRKRAAQQQGPVVPMSQQPLRPEPALLPPPGVELSIHSEALKLREQRLASEQGMEDLQQQIKLSRDTLQRRKDEGCGTKAALKKAEKDLIALTKAHNALRLKKEEEEIIKKREEAAAATKKSEEKKLKK